MATERLPMRHIREILRLKWTLRRSHRETARSLGISAGAVASVVSRAKAMALTWEAVERAQRRRLGAHAVRADAGGIDGARPGPDLVWIHTELRRPGVTLELLHLEYLAAHPDGYRYSAFCGHYRAGSRSSGSRCARSTRPARKRSSTTPGSGRRSSTPATGEVVAVELFVAVLGASNYTYAEATLTQRSVDFIQSHTHAVEYFGGVPAVSCRINCGPASRCRAGTSRASSGRMRTGRGTTARRSSRRDPAKPRDKAKVEVAVQVAERWILARLRHETFFTLAALNARIARAAHRSQ